MIYNRADLRAGKKVYNPSLAHGILNDVSLPVSGRL